MMTFARVIFLLALAWTSLAQAQITNFPAPINNADILEISGAPIVGASLQAEVLAPPGSSATFIVGTAAGSLVLPEFEILVDLPSVFLTVSFIVPSNGLLSVSTTVPSSIPAGSTLAFQVCIDTASGLTLSNLSTVSIVEEIVDRALFPGWAKTVEFGESSAFSTDNSPAFVAHADFDGDGFLDMATANNDSHEIAILLGFGDGTFGPPTYYPVGRPGHLRIRDLNDDGALDIISTLPFLPGTQAAFVLFGTGTGAFSDPITVFVASTARVSCSAAEDLNNDGILDIATSNEGADALSIMFGLAGGGFTGPNWFLSGIQPSWIESADFDNDGNFDLVATNRGSNNLVVLLGQGGGTFAPAVSYPVGSQPLCLGVGDFNGDGILDLTTADSGSGGVSFLLGLGNGTFAPGGTIFLGGAPLRLTIGDLDSDGFDDVVVADSSTSTVTTLRSFSGGIFSVVESIRHPHPIGVSLADLDADGHLDLSLTSDSRKTVSVFGGLGNGRFKRATYLETGDSPSSLVVDDFNNDGLPDIATSNTFSQDFSVFLAATGGGFLPSSTYVTGTVVPGPILSGDVNNDGNSDILIFNPYLSFFQGEVAVFLGSGTGSFAPSSAIPVSSQCIPVKLEDVNGDGNLDLILGALQETTTSVDRIEIFLGDGLGGFVLNQSIPLLDNTDEIVIADLNNDGFKDLLVSQSCQLYLYLGSSSGLFVVPGLNVSSGFHCITDATAADLNGDGQLDLVAISSFYDRLYVYFGDGTGLLAPPVIYDQDQDVFGVATGDLNDDGLQDVAITETLSGAVVVFLGQGAGALGEPVKYVTGVSPNDIKIADIDLDGHLDIAISNWYFGGGPPFGWWTVSILFNQR